MDCWWNAATENQGTLYHSRFTIVCSRLVSAIDRVHRIGQEKTVYVKHFIVSHLLLLGDSSFSAGHRLPILSRKESFKFKNARRPLSRKRSVARAHQALIAKALKILRLCLETDCDWVLLCELLGCPGPKRIWKVLLQPYSDCHYLKRKSPVDK